MISILWISGDNCPACDKLRKTLKEVQEEFPDVKITECTVNQLGKITLDKMNIPFVPFIIFKLNDTEVKRMYGSQPLNTILAVLDCMTILANIGV